MGRNLGIAVTLVATTTCAARGVRSTLAEQAAPSQAREPGIKDGLRDPCHHLRAQQKTRAISLPPGSGGLLRVLGGLMVCVGFKGHSGGANVGITATRKQTKHTTDVGITATPAKKTRTEPSVTELGDRKVLGEATTKKVGKPHRTRCQNGGRTSPNASPLRQAAR